MFSFLSKRPSSNRHTVDFGKFIAQSNRNIDFTNTKVNKTQEAGRENITSSIFGF